MEASEKPQLPLDEASGETGRVRALDDRLVIERLTVDDARAARVVREQQAERRRSRPRRSPRRSRSAPG